MYYCKKTYGTPRCIYRRYHIPFWLYQQYYPYFNSYSVIGSTIQEADQSIVNTGIASNLNQAINQLAFKI